MGRGRRILGNLLTVAASTLFAVLLLEGALRLMPVAWAPPVVAPSADNPIQRYAANAPFTWSLGWDFYQVVHGRTNAQGFVADHDYDAQAATPLVAVLGDSFVEALQVPFAQSLTARLQAALGARGRAYAIAQSGSPLSQYVAYAERAAAVYRPQKIVVVVAGNDFDESVYANRKRDGIYHLYPSGNGGFDFKLTPLPALSLTERVLRNSALALYLARNVGIVNLVAGLQPNAAHAAGPGEYVGNTSADANPARVAEGDAVIAWFLSALPKAAQLPPADIVIAVDAMRPAIYSDGAFAAAQSSYFGQMRKKLIASGKALGFATVDLDEVFRAAYARDRKPFEFPTDGHWNAYGHGVVAEAVRAALGAWPPQ